MCINTLVRNTGYNNSICGNILQRVVVSSVQPCAYVRACEDLNTWSFLIFDGPTLDCWVAVAANAHTYCTSQVASRPEPLVREKTNRYKNATNRGYDIGTKCHAVVMQKNMMGHAGILLAKPFVSNWTNNALAPDTSLAHWFAEDSTDTTTSFVSPNDDMNNRLNV